MKTITVELPDDFEFPEGVRKDRAVFRAPKQGEHFISDSGGLVKAAINCGYKYLRIVLIPEPQPYVWPPWCKLWGATIDQVNGVIKLWERPPAQSESGWNWNGGVIVFADAWKASGLTPPTRDHFADWTKPILNPHWKGE